MLTYLRAAPWVLLLLLLAHDIRMGDLRDRYFNLWQSERAGRLADRSLYESAQREAAAKNQADNARIESEYRKVTDDTQSAYARDHAELVRLRQQRATTAQGSAGKPGTPEDHTSATGAHGDGVPLSADEHLQASEIELRLMHLQNYVEGLLKANK